MIKYLKSEVKHLPLILVLCIVLYIVVRVLTNSLFQSKSGLVNNKETNLGDAVSSQYACVSNVSTYNQRLTAVENKFGNSSLTTTAETITESINEVNNKFNNSAAIDIANGGIGTTTAAGAREVLDAPSTGDLPTVTTTSFTENGILFTIAKYGNVVTLTLDGTLETALAASAAITTLSEEYWPSGTNVLLSLSTDQTGNINIKTVRGWIKTADGTLYSSVALTAGKTFKSSVTYVAQDVVTE